MSLILDALRKIERDKHTPNRGFVVMTHVPWRKGESGSPLLLIVLGLLSLAVAVLGVALWRSSQARPAGSPHVAAVAPTPLPVSLPPTATPVAAPTATAMAEVVAPPPHATPTPEAVSPVPPVTKPAAPPRPAARLRPTPPPSTPSVAAAAPTPRSTPSAAPATGLGGEIRLHAISRRDGQPVAILNDRLVHEGDSFDGVKVIRIDEASVEVEVQGRRRTVGF